MKKQIGKDKTTVVISKKAWKFLNNIGLVVREGGEKGDTYYTVIKVYKMTDPKFEEVFKRYIQTSEGREFIQGKANFERLRKVAMSTVPTKEKIKKKPFEGCVEIGKGKYVSEGFFDDDEETDKQFRLAVNRIKKKREIK